MIELDDLDYGILHLLQRDARNLTPVDMAEYLPVSDQTIRNRIRNMEEQGVIEGYVPAIDYGKSGFPIRLQLSCTVPVERREELAAETLRLPNVVRVEEMLSSRENLQILVVTHDSEDINEITTNLTDLGVTIEDERLRRRSHVQPFNHFGEQMVSEK